MMTAKEREESKRIIEKLLREAQALAEKTGFEISSTGVRDVEREKLQAQLQITLLEMKGTVNMAVSTAKQLGMDSISFLGGKIVWSHEGNDSINGPLLVDDNWSHSNCYLDREQYKWIYGHERDANDY